MRKDQRRTRIAVLVASVCAFGCDRGPSRSLDAPDEAPALKALQLSLASWQGGRRDSGGLIGEEPAVGVVDSLRPDRPLISFEVFEPSRADGTARVFAVRLQLGEPSEEIHTRYQVVGRDPLWVFRQEDYDLILHWEHKMPADSPTEKP